jgi:hypothetical protein
MFPLRVCSAIWEVTQSLKRAARSKKRKEFGSERKLSIYPLSLIDSPVSSHASAVSSDSEDFESGYFADVEQETTQHFHAILIPNFKEDLDILRETLNVLACYPQARDQYDVRCPWSYAAYYMLIVQ